MTFYSKHYPSPRKALQMKDRKCISKVLVHLVTKMPVIVRLSPKRFPPIKVQNSCDSNDTFVGDVLPQFTLTCRGHSVKYACVICKYFAPQKDIVLKGIKQVHQHATTKFHTDSCGAFEGRIKEPQIMNKPKQRKISEYCEQSSQKKERCYHIFDPYIVRSFEDDQNIHRLCNRSKFA